MTPEPPLSPTGSDPLPPPPVGLQRSGMVLAPDSSRVVIKPYFEEACACRERILETVLAFDEAETDRLLQAVLHEFKDRHVDFNGFLHERYHQVSARLDLPDNLSENKRLLLGAHFLSEYALESAALFNPSIVPHPNQTGVAEGSLRIIMSLRAIGEGHISSIEFRTGMIDSQGSVSIDPPSSCATAAQRTTNPLYRRRHFRETLREINATHPLCKEVMDSLPESFTRSDLCAAMQAAVEKLSEYRDSRESREVEAELTFLADCNYSVKFPSALPLSDRILMPRSPSEENGMEDARFVRFTEADGSTVYYATYTAYNGRITLPQLIATTDFTEFQMSTLGGAAAVNKGIAIFPRKVRGQYAALTRSDGCNNYISFSDSVFRWDKASLLAAPKFPWEVLKVGNCGSPIETPAGWLVLTHGVGAMRKYSIGAMLLDLDDPSRVIARLPEALISPNANEREGYVPNVVYTCGAILHGEQLVIPYAMGDYATTVATVSCSELIGALMAAR